jgi:hypothetical protein
MREFAGLAQARGGRLEKSKQGMLTNWKREQLIKSTLRNLSRQRVAMILPPNNVWVIENALVRGENTEESLQTCHMRGWVEPLDDSVPVGALTPEGKLPEGYVFSGRVPLYRLTGAGWNVIHRAHEWIVVTCVVSIVTLLATIIGLMLRPK